MTDWVAACMDPDEWALWVDANRRSAAHRISRPCDECPLGFALEMRAINRCNGEPSGAPEPDEQEETMDIARVSAQRVSVQVHAPCPTCLHRDVCAIKADVDSAGNAEVGLRSLSPALTPRLTVDLDCAFYLRDKAAGKTPKPQQSSAGSSGWTEERKAKWRDDMAARRAAKRAEREAAA